MSTNSLASDTDIARLFHLRIRIDLNNRAINKIYQTYREYGATRRKGRERVIILTRAHIVFVSWTMVPLSDNIACQTQNDESAPRSSSPRQQQQRNGRTARDALLANTLAHSLAHSSASLFGANTTGESRPVADSETAVTYGLRAEDSMAYSLSLCVGASPRRAASSQGESRET